MKIALVHVPIRHHKFSENLKVVDEEFTLSPPIILAYVASIAEKAGHKVILIDTHAERLTKKETAKRILSFNPDLLGFRLDTYCFHDTLEWIKCLKETIKVPVIAGGINFSLYPKETMRYSEIDFGFIGEVVETLPEFLKKYPGGDYKDIKGLCYRDKNGEIVINPPEKGLVSFDEYPFPARHLLPNHLYHSFVSQRKNFTIMLTSTGCPYRCNFCAIAGLKHYRERSAESVLAEIEECYNKFGIREIDFFDATFFVNKERCLEIFKGIRKKKLDISWTCRSRVDLVDEEILREAKKSGLRMVFWGIESGVDEILKNIKKDIIVEQVERAIKISKKIGIRNLGFLMLGNSGETEQIIRKTMKWSKKLGLDYVQICRAIPKPGSELHYRIVKDTGYDYWKEFVLGNVSERRIYVPYRRISEKRLEKLLKLSYYSFYFRPYYIVKTLFKMKSFEEFLRYVRVALRMIFHYFYTDVGITRKSKFIKKLAHLWKVKI